MAIVLVKSFIQHFCSKRGISKLQEKSVSLQANGEMLGAPVLPH